MKKISLCFECYNCGEKSPFEKTDLPTGHISPDNLDENKIFEVQCPKCKFGDIVTLDDVKKALADPQKKPESKSNWNFYWEE
jgi:hypothetical protein